MADETQYACPFCGEMSSSKNRGKHYAWHRRQGDLPLAMNAEVVQDDSTKLWSPVITLAESGSPVLVPDHYTNKMTRKNAERSLRAFIQATANGTGKNAAKGRVAVKEATTPPAPRKEDVSDEAIVAALVKLAGVVSIPVKQFTQVSEWVASTRTLMKEIAR